MSTRSVSIPDRDRAGLLITGVAVALLVRVEIGGAQVASSFAAALGFGAILIAVALGAGWRPGRLQVCHVLTGLAGAAVLIAFPVLLGRRVGAGVHGPLSLLCLWGALVALVAISEEVVLRGLLFTIVAARAGVVAATLLAAVIFALLHVPLYGWNALPLDLAVGVALGFLRVLTGGVTAPATAHLAADLATWWL